MSFKNVDLFLNDYVHDVVQPVESVNSATGGVEVVLSPTVNLADDPHPVDNSANATVGVEVDHSLDVKSADENGVAVENFANASGGVQVHSHAVNSADEIGEDPLPTNATGGFEVVLSRDVKSANENDIHPVSIESFAKACGGVEVIHSPSVNFVDEIGEDPYTDFAKATCDADVVPSPTWSSHLKIDPECLLSQLVMIWSILNKQTECGSREESIFFLLALSVVVFSENNKSFVYIFCFI